MPGNKTSDKSWKTRSRSANEMEAYESRCGTPEGVELTEQADAICKRSTSGQTPLVTTTQEIQTARD